MKSFQCIKYNVFWFIFLNLVFVFSGSLERKYSLSLIFEQIFLSLLLLVYLNASFSFLNKHKSKKQRTSLKSRSYLILYFLTDPLLILVALIAVLGFLSPRTQFAMDRSLIFLIFLTTVLVVFVVWKLSKLQQQKKNDNQKVRR